MASKQFPFRYSDEEKKLLDVLADKMGVDEITAAIRLAIREALEKRLVDVPAGVFGGKKTEGRPKENAALTELAAAS